MPTRTQDALREALLAALRELRRVGADREARTRCYREVARRTVDLRETFLTKAGAPDWAARTRAARDYISDVYRAAGYDATQAKAVQARARYHIGHLIRERLTPDEIEDLGLIEADQAQQEKRRRDSRSAILTAISPADPDGDPDAARALAAALIILQRSVTPARLRALGDAERAQALELIERITDRAIELASAAGRRAG